MKNILHKLIIVLNCFLNILLSLNEFSRAFFLLRWLLRFTAARSGVREGELASAMRTPAACPRFCTPAACAAPRTPARRAAGGPGRGGAVSAAGWSPGCRPGRRRRWVAAAPASSCSSGRTGSRPPLQCHPRGSAGSGRHPSAEIKKIKLGVINKFQKEFQYFLFWKWFDKKTR